MEYLDTAASFEELLAKVDLLAADGTKSMAPYSDYGSAVFGFRVSSVAELRLAQSVDSPPATVEGRVKAMEERASAMKAVLEASPVLAWMKFGKPLSSTLVSLESLEEIVSVTRLNPQYVPFRTGGVLPSLVDYSRAESGMSRILSVPQAVLSSAEPRLLGSTACLWPNDDWWVALRLLGGRRVSS